MSENKNDERDREKKKNYKKKKKSLSPFVIESYDLDQSVLQNEQFEYHH